MTRIPRTGPFAIELLGRQAVCMRERTGSSRVDGSRMGGGSR